MDRQFRLTHSPPLSPSAMPSYHTNNHEIKPDPTLGTNDEDQAKSKVMIAPCPKPGFFARLRAFLLKCMQYFFIAWLVLSVLAVITGNALVRYVGQEGVIGRGFGVIPVLLSKVSYVLYSMVGISGVTQTLFALGLTFFGDTVFHIFLYLISILLSLVPIIIPPFFYSINLHIYFCFIVVYFLATYFDRNFKVWMEDDETTLFYSYFLYRSMLRGVSLGLSFLPVLLVLSEAKRIAHAILNFLPQHAARVVCFGTLLLNRLAFLQLSNVGYNMLVWNIGWHLWGGIFSMPLFFCQDSRSKGYHSWAPVLADCSSFSTHSAALNCLCVKNLNCGNTTEPAACTAYCDSLTVPSAIAYGNKDDVEMCLTMGHVFFGTLMTLAALTFFYRLQRLAIIGCTTSLGLYLLDTPADISSFILKPVILPAASIMQRYISVPLTRTLGLDPTPQFMLPKNVVKAYTPSGVVWGLVRGSGTIFMWFAFTCLVHLVIEVNFLRLMPEALPQARLERKGGIFVVPLLGVPEDMFGGIFEFGR